jgi:hypothetical protein
MGQRGTDERRLKLSSHAQEFVTATIEAVHLNFHAPLVRLLSMSMRTLLPEQFEIAMSLAVLELKQRDRAPGAHQLLEVAARHVSEHSLAADSDSLQALVGVVLRLPGLPSTGMRSDQADAVGRLLRRHGLASSRTGIIVLPRLLTPQLADSLMVGEVYQMTQALAGGDGYAALRQISLGHSAALLGAAPKVHLAGGPASYVVLVACSEANGRTWQEATFGMSVENDAESSVLRPVWDPPSNRLAAVSGELAQVLDQPLMEVLQVGPFADASTTALVMERLQGARVTLRAWARDHGHGSGKLLAADRPVFDAGAITVTVRTRLAGTSLGAISWPQARYESASDALRALVGLLKSEGVAVSGPAEPQTQNLH